MTLAFNGQPATGAKVTMPRVGAWHADISADDDVAVPTGRVTIQIDGEDFVGTWVRGRSFVGRTPVRIVGGGGGLSRQLEAKNYSSGPSVRMVVKEILGSEETLSSTSSEEILSSVVPSYHRMGGGIASHALTQVLQKVRATWRVLADGTVWVGVDEFPEVVLDHVVEDEDWFSGIITITTEAPVLRPGVTFLGHQIQQVVHYSDTEGLRTEAHTSSSSSALGRFLGLIRREIDYTKRYPARVVAKNPDGTIQVMPDDDDVRGTGLDRVRVRSGVPGVVKPVKGARCLVGFDAGDPTRPYAEGWDGRDVEEVAIADGEAPAARLGSTVNVFFPPLVPVTGTLNGLPFVGAATFVMPGVGVIQDGNPKVKV